MTERGAYGPWLPRLRQGPVRLTSPQELAGWVRFEDDRLLVLDKPGDFVCHPSKEGPWSSLVGAVREYLRSDAVHLVFRLDRETSGLVVFAKDPQVARRLQMAAQHRRYGKTYYALLTGEMTAPVTVDRPLAPDLASPVSAKVHVPPDGSGQPAITHFTPVQAARGFTLARVTTETGRKHQIRAHARWLGHCLVGDKIYGPDERLFLQFIEHGWNADLEARLLLARQALHCAVIDLRPAGESHVFASPLPADIAAFTRQHMGLDSAVLT